MQDETTEKWKVVAEQATKEQDPKRLSELINEIIRLLDEQPSQPNK